VRPRDKHAPCGFTVHPVALCSALVGCDATFLIDAALVALDAALDALDAALVALDALDADLDALDADAALVDAATVLVLPPRRLPRPTCSSAMTSAWCVSPRVSHPVCPVPRASSPPAALLFLGRAGILTDPLPVSSPLRRRYLRRG
jgi:hypothetical protein